MFYLLQDGCNLMEGFRSQPRLVQRLQKSSSELRPTLRRVGPYGIWTWGSIDECLIL